MLGDVVLTFPNAGFPARGVQKARGEEDAFYEVLSVGEERGGKRCVGVRPPAIPDLAGGAAWPLCR